MSSRTGDYLFPNGIVVGIGGCSAVGKSTVIDQISEKIAATQAYSITTRSLRGPEDKQISMSVEMFNHLMDSGKLVEVTFYDRAGYAISKDTVSAILSQNRIALIDANEDGIQQLLQTNLAPDVITIFLVCDAEELFKRQLSRGAGTKESRLYRLKSSMIEIEGVNKPDVFQFVVYNSNVGSAVDKILRIIEGKKETSDWFDVTHFKREMSDLLATLEQQWPGDL